MKKRLSRCKGLILIASYLLGLSGFMNTSAQITQSIAWTKAYDQVASGTFTSTSFAIPNGSNRILIVGVTSSNTSSTTYTNPTVTYGGVALTNATSNFATNGHQHTCLYFLKDNAVMNNTSQVLSVAVSGTIVNSTTWYAVFTGVSQIPAAYTTGNGFDNSAGNTPAQLTNAMAVNANVQAIYISSIQNTTNTTLPTYTINANWISGGNNTGLNIGGAEAWRNEVANRAIPITNTTDNAITSTLSPNSCRDAMSAMSLPMAPPLASEPTIQASNVTFSSVSGTQMTINWTPGNGSNRIVLVKSGYAVDSDPIDGNAYTANTTYGSGTQLGTGNFVVYTGTGINVTVTGLTSSATYHVAVYEFNGTGGTQNYLTTNPAIGNQLTLAAAGDYRSAASGNWNALATWQRFNGTIWATPTAGQGTPTSASGKINILNGHTITVTANVTVDQVIVEAGGQVTINSNFTINLANGTGTDMAVSGTVLTNSTGGNGGFTINGNTNLVFNNGGTLIYNVNGDVIPTAAWDANSTCSITGVTSTIPAGLDQNFGDVIYNCLGQTGNENFAPTSIAGNLEIISTGTSELRLNVTPLTVGGDLIISGGIFRLAAGGGGGASRTLNVSGNVSISGGTLLMSNGNIGTLNVSGNFSVAASGTIDESGTGSGSINFNGSGAAQTYTSGGTVSNAINFTVNSGSTLDMGTSVMNGSTGTFTLSPGAGIITGNSSGLASTGTTGSIQVSGARTYNTGANYTFDGTSVQVTGTGLTGANNLTIDNSAGVSLSNTLTTVTGTILINSGKLLTIDPGKQLTVSGTLTNNAGEAGLVIKSNATGTGSLIHPNANIQATVQRYIVAASWLTWDDGWHFLSSPVTAQSISPEFTPAGVGNDYDFYAWDEPTTTWINYKNAGFATLNPGTNFVAGKGYMVAYQQTGTMEFAGALNVANISKTGLTKTASTPYSWNLLGNPYPCALTWFTGWTPNNIGAVCQIWNEAMRSYTSLIAGNSIPAMNGFMVEALINGASLTIPATGRIHSSTSWYKNTATSNMIKLTAWEEDKKTGKESKVILDPNSTTDFDPDFDGHYLSDFAPQFYSMAGDDQLSVNTLPELSSNVQIPFVFVKNTASNFTIELDTENVIPDLTILLNDTKTGVQTNLSQNPVYAFTAAEGDDINRFVLHFLPATGVATEEENNGTQVFVSDNILYINQPDTQGGKVYLYSITGQLINTFALEASPSQSINLPQMTPGIYMVNIRTSLGSCNHKVVIR